MRRIAGSLILSVAALAVLAVPASAEFFGCKDPKVTVRDYVGAASHYARADATNEYSAQSSRPRITIRPRHKQLSANSVRQCRAQLVKEYRPSGTVIVPRMQCWWE